jgi:hypothetical protein
VFTEFPGLCLKFPLCATERYLQKEILESFPRAFSVVVYSVCFCPILWGWFSALNLALMAAQVF